MSECDTKHTKLERIRTVAEKDKEVDDESVSERERLSYLVDSYRLLLSRTHQQNVQVTPALPYVSKHPENVRVGQY
mgnify:CR=1